MQNRKYLKFSEDVYEGILKSLDKGVLSKREQEYVADLMWQLHPSDMAVLLERLPIKQRKTLFSFVNAEEVGEVLTELSDGVSEQVLKYVSSDELLSAISELESDDVVDIVQNLDDIKARRTKSKISTAEKKLLQYPEDTAGGLMRVERVTLAGNLTVRDTLKYIRDNSKKLPKVIHNVYVIGRGGKLVGLIELAKLVRVPLSKKLKDVMHKNLITVPADMDQEDVAHIFEKYHLFGCPVIDKHGKLLGSISVDDILDVIVEEHEQDIMLAAGLREGDDLFAPLSITARKRFPWLIINLFTALLASMVISLFADQISRLVALAVLMPIVASMGGNAGTQTMTVAVRGLATKHITGHNALQLLKKELLVGGFNGFLLSLLVALGTIIVYGDYQLGLVICAATIINHILAATAGILVPVLIEKYGKDPAISAGVLVTTVTDVGGFFAFLGLAAIFLL